MKSLQLTETEWETLSNAPLLVGFATIAADPGVVAGIRASGALMAMLTDRARELEGHQGLVAEVLARVNDEVSEEDEVVSDVDEGLAAIRAALAKVPPAEASAFRTFLVDVARHVAGASGGGLVGHLPDVSKEERRFIDKVQRALGSD